MNKVVLLICLTLFFCQAKTQRLSIVMHQIDARAGDEFLGNCKIEIDKAAKVTGAISWTVVKIGSANSKYYKGKMNAKAIEYITGNYNASSKQISVAGFEKDDPQNIISLDAYKLTLDGKNKVSGKNKGAGRWDGILTGTYTDWPKDTVITPFGHKHKN